MRSCRVCHVFAGSALRQWHDDAGGGIGGGGEGGGQGKLTSCLRYCKENVLPVKTTTVCLCTFGD